MAFPVVASSVGQEASIETTGTVLPDPAGVSVGDLVVHGVAMGPPGVGGIINPSSGWDTLVQQVVGTSQGQAALFARVLDGTADDTLTVNSTDTDQAGVTIGLRITGHAVTNPATDITVGTVNTGTSAAGNPGDCNPGVADDYLWLAWCAIAGNIGTSFSGVPTNYTLVFADTVVQGEGLSCAQRDLNASSEDAGAFAHTSRPWAAYTIAISGESDPSTGNVTVTGAPLYVGADLRAAESITVTGIGLLPVGTNLRALPSITVTGTGRLAVGSNLRASPSVNITGGPAPLYAGTAQAALLSDDVCQSPTIASQAGSTANLLPGGTAQPLPSGSEAGNVVVYTSVMNDPGPTADDEIIGSSGWWRVASDRLGSSQAHFGVWVRLLDGTADDTLVLRPSDPVSKANISRGFRIINHGVEHPLKDIQIGLVPDGTSSAPDPPTVGAGDQVLNRLVMAFAALADTVVTVNAPPANYTLDYSLVSGDGLAVASRQLAAASEDPGPFTLSGSALWEAFSLSIPPYCPVEPELPCGWLTAMTPGRYVETPAPQVTWGNDLTLQFVGFKHDWTPAGDATLVDIWQEAGNQRSWRFRLNSGIPTIDTSPNGVTSGGKSMGANISSLNADGTVLGLAVALDGIDGANSRARWWYSLDAGETWIDLAHPAAAGATISIFSGSAPLRIYPARAASLVSIRVGQDGTPNGGTEVFRFDGGLSGYAPTATSFIMPYTGMEAVMVGSDMAIGTQCPVPAMTTARGCRAAGRPLSTGSLQPSSRPASGPASRLPTVQCGDDPCA